MELWTHQKRAIDDCVLAYRDGVRALALTMPTGMGKSVAVCELVKHYAGRGFYAAVYTNRKLMVDQLSAVLDANGIRHGVRAADYKDERDVPVQVSSIHTERSRTLDDAARWNLHGMTKQCLAVFDEAHLHREGASAELLRRHLAAGHLVLGVTATPVGLGHQYERLIVGGTLAEGRSCGALVPALHYGCDEPDTRKGKEPPLGDDFSTPQLRKLYPRTPKLMGRVLDWYAKLNPDRRPAILFAPGVAESLWFAEEFRAAGITAAHIDGDCVSFGERDADGYSVVYNAGRHSRQEVLDGSRDGSIQVVCNRFVLREGIDAPWLSHGIFATIFGSLQSYLQSGGRLLRSALGLESVTVQDHGGNWWRHGSLNADRRWTLTCTASAAAGAYRDHQQENPDRQPFLCPGCRKVLSARVCPACGYEVRPGLRSRPVVQEDGEVVELRGDVWKPRRACGKPNGAKLWQRMYWRARSHKVATKPDGTTEEKGWDATFAQAEAQFARENNWGWPDRSWPLMPRDPYDFYRLVRDVPMEALTGGRKPEEAKA